MSVVHEPKPKQLPASVVQRVAVALCCACAAPDLMLWPTAGAPACNQAEVETHPSLPDRRFGTVTVTSITGDSANRQTRCDRPGALVARSIADCRVGSFTLALRSGQLVGSEFLPMALGEAKLNPPGAIFSLVHWSMSHCDQCSINLPMNLMRAGFLA